MTYERTTPRVAERSTPRRAAKRVTKLVDKTTKSDAETRLATLERLRSAGTITDEEYAARRTRILDEI